MKKSPASNFRTVILTGVAVSALLPSLAQAQDAGASDGNGDAENEIVVTGTILRGAAPVGSQLISVGAAQVQSQGATTANELMATVPQVSNLFNNVPTARLGVASNQIQVVRPNLRNLANETSSSASTLVIFDGHRIASVGVTQNAVDPDLVPTLAIERVEVVTDGGSATYGSDAIGGVINFITRKRFDGVKVQARYGFADNYYQVDAGAIVGKEWETGSIYAAYNYQHNDAIFGRDRDFIRDVDWLSPGLTPRGRFCSPGNVQMGLNMFALPALTSATPNVCDPSDDKSVVPRSTRHGALVSLHQDLADWLTVDIRGFYGERKSETLEAWRGSTTVTGGSSAANTRQFYYTPVPGQNASANQTVFFTFAPLLGTNSLVSGSSFKEWGGNAEFTARLTDNWQLRTLFNYSESNSEYHIPQLNQTLLNQFSRSTAAATAINFYNPSAADLPLIQRLIDAENGGEGRESLLNIRAIIDGSLFTLPGGDVKVAVGVEHLTDRFQQRIAPVNEPIGRINSVAYTPYNRKIDSLFAEVQVPIVGAENRGGFIHELTLSGSVRYDHFSDVSSTTNPKIGVNLRPVSWFGLRGNYSTSFNAPSPVDQLGSLRNTAQFFPINAFVRPGDIPSVTGTVSLQGANPGLTPQTAKSYSFGMDIEPPVIPGMRISANYYNVKFKNIIRQPSPNSTIFVNFPNNVLADVNGVTITQLQDFLNSSGAPNAAAALAGALGRCNTTTGVCNIYELVDFRQGNYGTVNIEGIDFSANYRTTTSFGGIDFGVSGNYALSRKSQTGIGAPVLDDLKAMNVVLPNGARLVSDAVSRLQLQAVLGADIGNFRAQATLNHNGGFGLVRCDATTTPACSASATGVATANGQPQDRVGAFNTINLFFKYAVPGDSLLLRDLELTLNINNVFDQDPPLLKRVGASTPGYANGFTLGRLVQLGLTKKF
jgi:iron complex outermembrane receptor protein